jgi:aspartate dehydrogenase
MSVSEQLDMRPSRARANAAVPRIGLIGWGAISRALADALVRNEVAADIVVIGTRGEPEQPPAGAMLIRHPAELAACRLDMVIEAAGREAVEPWGMAALEAAGQYVVCSTGAFADPGILCRLVAQARTTGGRIVIPAGAIGGLDALAAAAYSGLDLVTHTIRKSPISWRGASPELDRKLQRCGQSVLLYEGAARQAALDFPRNANVVATVALAGIGFERTRVMLVADPSATGNGHHICASGGFGSLEFRIENLPLPENPKTSWITALSLARLIANRDRPIAI